MAYDPNIEEWRQVGELEASSLGRVRRPSGRVLNGDVTNKGYHRIRLGEHGSGATFFAHRLVCEAFHGPAPSLRHHVCHRDDDRLNNVPSNLYWGTPKQNCEDRYRNGRSRAQLDSRAVQIIRFEYANAKRRANGKKVARGLWDRLSSIFHVSKDVARNAVRAYIAEPKHGV